MFWFYLFQLTSLKTEDKTAIVVVTPLYHNVSRNPVLFKALIGSVQIWKIRKLNLLAYFHKSFMWRIMQAH